MDNCRCVNVDFGSYDNTVLMKPPFPLFDILGEKKLTDFVSIDTCIASEIGFLWHHGVVTLNSCCGHKKIKPSVIVDDKSIKIMHKLGYEHSEEESARPDHTFNLIRYEHISR